MNTNRIAVTGMGMVSPVGFNIEENWNSLLNSDMPLQKLDFSQWGITDIPIEKANTIDKSKLREFVSANNLKKMDDSIAYSLIAAEEAIHAANIEQIINETPDRIGVTIGSTFAGLGFAEKEYLGFLANYENNKYPKASAYLSIAMFQCAASGQVSIKHGLKGKIYSLPNGNTSGIDSVFNSIQALKSKTVDIMLAGSSEAPLTPFCISSLLSLNKLNRAESANSCSPFSDKEEGFVLGEGGGILVLENLAHALKRNARVHAEVIGAYSIMDKDLVSAGKKCLDKLFSLFPIEKSEIDFIMAYGDGTDTDKAEIEILKGAFGNSLGNIPITNIKSMTGNALAASSSMEMIIGIVCMNNNKILPIAKDADWECIDEAEIFYVKQEPLEKEIKSFLVYSLGFAGKFSAAVFKKYPLDASDRHMDYD